MPASVAPYGSSAQGWCRPRPDYGSAMGIATGERGPVAPWRLGVDVGGTFTDLVLADATGRLWVVKVPSVPADPSRGVLEALAHLAARLDRSTGELLTGCALFVHGSTVATNTLLEGKGAKVGLLTTEGFRDALEIRRGLREDQWDHRAPYAPVLVPRYLRRGVRGRLDRNGEELEPLALDDVDAALAVFEEEGVEAVAIALFNSFVDDRHEVAVAEALRDRWDGRWVSRSAAVLPMMGEYERTSTVVVNALLAPKVVDYLRALDDDLRALGLPRPVLLVQSNGGAASVDQLTARPVNLLLSGPAAAVGALELYRRALDRATVDPDERGNLISMEMGGTSCDVLLMSGGRVATKDDVQIAGYHVSTPSIDIHTIGAGGGTIAWVDSAGMLHVGPAGAGADPGPACYGWGGTEPTVTDAQLVLGRLRPGPYAGGAVTLDAEAAREAIRGRVAEPLRLSVEDAAAGNVAVLEQNLLHAVEYMSIERGHSPRRFTLVAAGGAGPMHGAIVARGLGCPRLLVPRDAGALCAVGMLQADIRQDFVRFLMAPLDEADPAEIADGLAALADQAVLTLAAEGIPAERVTLERELDLRYSGQLWSIRVPVDAGPVDPARVRAGFEAEYRRLYGHVQPKGTIVVSSLRITGRAATGELAQPAREPDAGQPRPVETRKVWHGEHGWLDTPVYAGADLRAGHRLRGPLLVEELTTTVLVGPFDELAVEPTGNFLVDVRAQAEPGPPGPARQVPGTEDAPASAPREAAASTARRDPVVLALMQNRLDQISRHMGWVMTRTARSTIFSQSHDFSCFVTAPDGTLVANADGIPIHTGGGGFAVRALLSAFTGRIHPEDVFILSDPYVAGGNHLPDWVVARPIFVDATVPHAAESIAAAHEAGHGVGVASPDGRAEPRLVGFCCNRAHQSDIGGGLAGTSNPEATEIWQEGIRLPVLKLVDRGEVRDDLWQLLLINSRTPELLDGDLRAMLGSTRIGAERVAALADELGCDSYDDHVEGILDHADARMREAVRALPDGVYRGEDHTDNDCFRKVDVAVRVTLTVVGDELTVDFTGTDPQIAGFKNSSLANTYSAVYLALSSFFDADIPRNEATYRCVTLVAPEGTIVNARPPAPMTMNTVFVAHEIVHAVWKALAEAEPARGCAGWSKTMHGHVAGVDDEGRAWVMYQWHAMGTPGATPERDGFAQMGHLITLGGLDLPNLEFHEQIYPVRYRRWEQRCDAAGPGRRRGGTGVCYEADILRPAAWSFRAEGLDTPSGYGLAGGGDGRVGQEWVVPADEAVDGPAFVPPKYGVRRLGPARMTALTPGGGGWGDPFEREPELVLRDVRDEVVGREAAEHDYGVVLSPDGRSVDRRATADRRRRPGH
jgi:N-methylhydantoinase A